MLGMSAKPLILATVVVASVFLPPHQLEAAVSTINGNELYTDCTGNANAPTNQQWLLIGYCIGYLIAVTDALSTGNSINGFKACIPINADMNQIRDVATNFIQGHPEKRHLVAVGLIAEAFALAFPCRPTKQPN
jgi:hypothetical protein